MPIIKAKLKHLNALIPLFDAYRVFYRQTSDLKAAEAFLRTRLEKQDTLIYMVYVEDQAVGFTHVFHSFSSVSMQPLFVLNDLFVEANYRKQGHGVALMDTVKALCKTLQYKGIALQTEITNPAQHLYESLGWKKDEDLHYMWLIDEL